MSPVALRLVGLLLFIIVCAGHASAEIECGGPLNKRCPTIEFYCCGNKPMKRPRVDEAGAAPQGLTESVCLNHIDVTGLGPEEQLRRKKFVCPLKQFRQYNGEVFPFGGGVPPKRPKQRQRYVRPLAAGLSWGLAGETGYCTIGAILCSKTDVTKRWFVANKHCVLEDNWDLESELFNAEAATSQYEVSQPSGSLQDRVENPHARGPEVIGKVVFYYRKWVQAGDGYLMDISLIELDSKIPVRADVFVGDRPMKAKPVRGSMTLVEFDSIKPRPRLCISGRSGGWGCFPVREVIAQEGILEMMSPDTLIQTPATQNINPHYVYRGNSGSVFWKKDAGGYRAVGLFMGSGTLMPIHDVLDTIRAHTTHHLDLHVCTEESNTFPKKSSQAKKKKKKPFLL